MTVARTLAPIVVDGHEIPAGSILWTSGGRLLFHGREIEGPWEPAGRVEVAAAEDAPTARDDEYQGAPSVDQS